MTAARNVVNEYMKTRVASDGNDILVEFSDRRASRHLVAAHMWRTLINPNRPL